MRGDRPVVKKGLSHSTWFTPHARGSTGLPALSSHRGQVYPACAGIDRTGKVQVIAGPRLPRMRGDRPISAFIMFSSISFTPHARGSTLALELPAALACVYPACAGIDPDIFFNTFVDWSLPRMRGDRPDKGLV